MSKGFPVRIEIPRVVPARAEDGSVELVEVVDWRLEGRNIVLVLDKRATLVIGGKCEKIRPA